MPLSLPILDASFYLYNDVHLLFRGSDSFGPSPCRSLALYNSSILAAERLRNVRLHVSYYYIFLYLKGMCCVGVGGEVPFSLREVEPHLGYGWARRRRRTRSRL